MSTILLVGNDEFLLQSRAAVLRTTNADTVTIDACELTRHSVTEPVDLVVLCHTLNPAVREALSDCARRQWPGIHLIQVLKTEYEWTPTLNYADQTVL
jgi:hypothetical protein